MIDKKTWDEFRSTGLLLFINSILHIFGWAIVVKYDDDDSITAYPARVKFRGFDEKSTTESYKNVSKYMVENAKQLQQEANE